MRDHYCGALGVRVRAPERRDRARVVSRDDRIGRGNGAADRRREEGAARATHRRRRSRAVPRTGVRQREALLDRRHRRARADARRGDRARRAMPARGKSCIGMAHRGRLNVLTHVMGKSYRALFEEFEGRHPDDERRQRHGRREVPHGLSRRSATCPAAASVDVELVPNPSHLEVVNPVVAGVARARQRVDGGAPNARDEAAVLPIVVHGDASFAGRRRRSRDAQHVAAARISRRRHRCTSSRNNQVGFTTDPIDARSTHYASDPREGLRDPDRPRQRRRRRSVRAGRASRRSPIASGSIRISSSTSWATGVTATTRRISRRSRSR